MRIVNTHYYRTRDPFGKDGDFITAPEVSQMFGEIIGLWAVNSWQSMGSPKSFQLIELGPGRGTLMKDLLRATKHIPKFHDAIDIQLIEVSPVLKKIQKQNIIHNRITWHKSFETIIDKPFILIANEFFDALPIYQFIKEDNIWKKKSIGLNENEELVFTLDQESLMINLIPETKAIFYESCPEAVDIVAYIAKKISEYGGAALIIDYGYLNGSNGDTLQAVKNHKYHNILKNSGEADLTAHVDFKTLIETSKKFKIDIVGPMEQSEFLKKWGIEIRKKQLLKNATIKQKLDLLSGINRLISPNEMGSLFKVLEIKNVN